MTDPFPLAANFPPTTQAEWRKLVDAALKGADFDKRLVSRSHDGLRVEPLYARAAGKEPIRGRTPGEAWTLMQRVDHPDPAAANTQALDDLENGATGLVLVLAGAPAAHGFGLVANEAIALEHALSRVMLDLIPLRIETSPFAGRPFADLVMEVVAARELDPSKLAIDFGLDPIGDMARSGGAILAWPDLSARAGATAKNIRAKGFTRSRFLRADGRAVHDAGGSEAQELAFCLAAGVAYLRLLEANGFTLSEARARISFLLAADADEFMTIAKFRAVRKLWARIEQACGLSPEPAFVGAETAWRMTTRHDPYVNMLRATIAVAAAGVGGANAVNVLPFTAALGLPDPFARRVARNTQLILLEESNLFRVADPAAGSGAVEHLTTQIARAAWALFQEIEAAGGAAGALERELIQRKVAEARTAREAAIARRKDAITGSSDYPNLHEAPVAVLDVARLAIPSAKFVVTFAALPQVRSAEPFEALRDASDRMLAKTGGRPKVFIANLGKLSDFTARATFAKNFYEAGGIEALSNDGFRDQSEMIRAFKASGTRLACLCSSDKVYEKEAALAAEGLTGAGAIVHLAGRPGTHEKEWRRSGVKEFIYVGCDALSILQTAHDILRVNS